ncbi:MAG: AraC family transcriptional regulator, partial [Tannerella sp.]|jgi:AraC-like DNA-binding protein|nr:AraC family transcriptional regulator [Tannerella sp.]
VLQVIHHRAFACYSTVFLLTLMLDQILIYRFVHIITATGGNDRFSRLHYVLPLLLTAVSVVTDLIVPFEQQETVIYGKGDGGGGNGGGNGWVAALYSLTRVVFVAYNSLYPALGLLRIRRYSRRIEDYSADAQRTSLNWLRVMQALTLITIPVPLAGLLFDVDVFSDFYFSMQGVLPSFFIYPILCYNLLSDNYVIILPDDENRTDSAAEIDPKRFTRYLRDKKPYLNPQLRITDVAAGLCTNRNYVSSFINREYGMNFSRFINRCRLKELNRLRLSPDHEDNTNLELVLMAGFSSYRSYLRVKSEEDRASVLKAF